MITTNSCIIPNIIHNCFRVVHFHNKSQKYHLTKAILLDCVKKEEQCFFSNIFYYDIDEFNYAYNSFATLISRNDEIEADLYLNVHQEALNLIIEYVQNGEINDELVYAINFKTMNQVIDLATTLGMPNLVQRLTDLHQTNPKINAQITQIESGGLVLYSLLNQFFCIEKNLPIDQYSNLLHDFLEQNKQLITDHLMKSQFYANQNPLITEFLFFLCNLFSLSSSNSLSKVFNRTLSDINPKCLSKYTVDEVKKVINKYTTDELKQFMNQSTIDELKIMMNKYSADELNVLINQYNTDELKVLINQYCPNNITQVTDNFTPDQIKEIIFECLKKFEV